MRKQNKLVLWPIYFDANKTRREGRKVHKRLAVSSPKIEELQRAASRLKLQPETIFDAVHPSFPWQKSGLLVIPRKEPKVQILNKVAIELLKLRK